MDAKVLTALCVTLALAARLAARAGDAPAVAGEPTVPPAAGAGAEATAPASEAERFLDLRTRMAAVQRRLLPVRERLGLTGDGAALDAEVAKLVDTAHRLRRVYEKKVRDALAADQELVRLQQAQRVAQDAAEAKVRAKLQADPEGAKLQADVDEISRQLVALRRRGRSAAGGAPGTGEDVQKQLGELRLRMVEQQRLLNGVKARLGLAGESAAQDADVAQAYQAVEAARRAVEARVVETQKTDPEIAQFRQAAEASQAALDAKVREKLQADPEGAALVAELVKLETELKSLRPPAAAPAQP